MSTLFPKALTAHRKIGSYIKGVWTESAPTVVSFTGSVQPLTAKDMENTDLGRKDIGMVKVYSGTPLQVSTEGGDNQGDWVIWQGRYWELFRDMAYQNDLIPHYKYLGEDRGVVS